MPYKTIKQFGRNYLLTPYNNSDLLGYRVAIRFLVHFKRNFSNFLRP